jgi:hypothetical protein
MQPRSSGRVIACLQAFVARQGDDAWANVLANLGRADAAELTGIITPLSWYPTISVFAALHTTRRLYGHDDFYDVYGTHAAEFALTRLHRFVMKFTSPDWIIDRGTRIWHDFHDTGHWTVEEAREGYMRGRLQDFGVVDSLYCRVLSAWLTRMGKATGALHMEIKHPRCRADGAAACVWEGRW